MLDQAEINRLWEAVTRTSREVVWAVGPDGSMTFVNGAITDMLGVPPTDLIGRDPFWMVDEQDVAGAKRTFYDCVERKVGWHDARIRLLGTDGVPLWIETSGIPHVSDEGRLIGFTATTRQLSSDDSRLEELRLVRGRIEEVIAERRLRTVWQPIFSLATGRVAGVEALTRFDHPVEQCPSEWFAEAAKVGLGPKLEVAAVETALRAAAEVPEGIYLSLNASPASVLSGDLRQVLLSAQIPPSRIVIELTEHVSIEDYGALSDRLGELRSHGVRLAVDDAGAGFASFRHILRLAPDIIKLDQSITQGINDSRTQRALAEALVHFAIDAGSMTIVAEGIEHPVDLTTVSSVGVDQAQGFYLGRPVGPDSVDWEATTPEPPNG